MIKIGKHEIPTGSTEDVVSRPTLWERLMIKLFPDPWAAEEREALLQHARRIKLKTDLQEVRILDLLEKQNKRKQDLNKRVTVATQWWHLKNERLGKFKALIVYSTDGSGGNRLAIVESVRCKNNYMHTDEKTLNLAFNFIKGTIFYKTGMQMWLNEFWDNEKLRKHLETDAENVKWVE